MTTDLTPAPSPPSTDAVAAMRGVVVRFGETEILHGVDLELHAGEIHALVGQNGAGKSTLVKALTGTNPLAAGTVEVGGDPIRLAGPADARERGIEIVHQDQPLAPRLTVAENMMLGRETTRAGVVLDQAAMNRTCAAVLKRLGASCAPDDVVEDLTATQRVQVCIAAALAQSPRVLVLDEPTAALPAAEAEHVFDVMRTARADGVALLYISHRLGEITALADRVTVLRDGHRIDLPDEHDVTTRSLITAMVGHEVGALYPPIERDRGAELLRVDDLRAGGLVRGVDLSVRAGEVVGLAGLVGSGASETLLALFGDVKSTGTVQVAGNPAGAGRSREAMRRGFALIPEERRTEALFPGLPVRANLTAASLGADIKGLVLSGAREKARARALVDDLSVVTRSPEQDIATLSGGNQQKVVVGRWLARGGQVYLVDEPTAGVDVGAKIEIYRQIGDLAAGGACVLVTSSDFAELAGICDRVLVMRDGVVAEEMTGKDMNEAEITARAAESTNPAGADTPDASPADRTPAGGSSSRRRALVRQSGVAVAMLAVAAALVIGAPGLVFGSGGWDLLRQAATPALLATALAVALGAGAFDLSVGAVASLTATVSASLVAAGTSPVVALLAGLAIGAVVGTTNGLLTVLLKVPSFVATLGMLFLLVGVTLAVNGGLALGVETGSSFLLLGQGFVGPVPAVAITVAVLVTVTTLLWRSTTVGLRWRAVGDHAEASRLRGVAPERALALGLATSGALAGLAGVLLASYSGGATARDASLDLLVAALAAVFLGSALTRTFLFDPATAAVASLFVTVVGAGLIANGLSDQWLGAAQGLVLLLAVTVAVARRRTIGQVVVF